MIYKLTNYNPDPVSLPDGKILHQGESDFIVIFNEVVYMVNHALPIPNDPILLAQASLFQALLPLINSNQVVTEMVTAGNNEQTWIYEFTPSPPPPIEVIMPLHGKIGGLSFVVGAQASSDAILKATRDGETIAELPISKTLGIGSVSKMNVPVTQSPYLRTGDTYDLEVIEQGSKPTVDIINNGASAAGQVVYNYQSGNLEYGVAQIFEVAEATCAIYVEYKVSRIYAPVNSFVWVELWEVTPATFELVPPRKALSSKVWWLTFPGDGIDMVCHFEFPASGIKKDTPYALILRASGNTGPGNYYQLRGTGDLYPGGILVGYKMSNGVMTITTLPFSDAWFKIGTGGPLAPTVAGLAEVRYVAG